MYGKVTSFRVISTPFFVIADRELVSQIYSHTHSKVFTTRGKNGIKFFIPMSLLGFENTDAQWKRHRLVSFELTLTILTIISCLYLLCVLLFVCMTSEFRCVNNISTIIRPFITPSCKGL